MRLRPLTDFLRNSKEGRLELTLRRIEGIIGERLPESAREHRQFWSNSEQNLYSRAWREAGYNTTAAGVPTGTIVFVRVGTATALPSPKAIPDPGRAPAAILLGCVSTKGPVAAAAKDLYISDLWRKRRAYAEASGLRWLILSAKYGLIDPDESIEPYDVEMVKLRGPERLSWGEGVTSALRQRFGELKGKAFEIHAGDEYVTPIGSRLRKEGAEIVRPLEGLRFGEQLAWYTDRGFTGRLEQLPAPAEAPHIQPTPQPPVHVDKQAIVKALLDFDRSEQDKAPALTSHPEANALVLSDDFAFLLSVIFDQGIPYERAWQGPYLLKQRLGYLDPERIAADPDAVLRAVKQPPALHRYVNNVPGWLVAAARIVIEEYEGDAGNIWNDQPTADELQTRLKRFPGIGQKKAAMAVELLMRERKLTVREQQGSDIAYDIHIRRVFLRTGLAERDDPTQMIAVARELHPQRPGELDLPAWRIGVGWCHPTGPECPACPLTAWCPKLIPRADSVE
ncbi:MAG: DUF6884 domain-containing protein [Actinomycetota bacterium]